jgi:hypothetical protein
MYDVPDLGGSLHSLLPLFLAIGCGGSSGGGEPAPSRASSTATTPTNTTTTSVSEEVCDGVDNDGDGEVDEEGGAEVWRDADGDGYGDPNLSSTVCEPDPDDWVDNSDDCDDTNPGIHPDVYDGCDGVDSDCDGSVDEDHREGWWLGTMEDGALYEIDRTTGVATRKVEFAALNNLVDISWSSTDLLEAGIGMAHQWPDYKIWQFDVCTGNIQEVGPTGVVGMGGISFGPNGRLFGFSHLDDAIVEINPSTGAATELYALPFDAGMAGMAYDCSTETLYAVDIDTDQLFTIDSTTGQILTTLPITPPLEPRLGMEWDNANRTLILASDDTLFTLDPATGVSTRLAAISGQDLVNDLAFFPTCAN